LNAWAIDRWMQDDAGMCRQIASLTESRDQWNAYSSAFLERLQAFQPGSVAREATYRNSFDPTDMKRSEAPSSSSLDRREARQAATSLVP
jgi:type IV secretion system protein VirD4